MTRVQKTVALLVILLLTALAAAQEALPPPQLKLTDTPYYRIYSDLSPERLREATLRMTKMAEEYHRRTAGFAGVLRERMPAYLYCTESDYLNAGGAEGSGGYFDGEKLVAITTDRDGLDPWHTIQHEAFHQFAKIVIGGELPVWVNEGLAEYFGEALFTGDSFVTGLIPQDRLERVRDLIKTDKYVSITKMMAMSNGDWNGALAVANYDQAWSMVHFLVHAENGKYQPAFNSFIQLLSRGQLADRAWETTFGDARGFETRWKDYWLKLPDNPTADSYTRARVLVATSFLARATAAKHTFASFEEFSKAADRRAIRTNPDEWLPPDLLRGVLAASIGQGDWSLEGAPSRMPGLLFTSTSGRKFSGTFTLMKGRVKRVDVTVLPAARPAAATTQAPARPPRQ
jgi:hypothetical protein